MRGRNWQRQLPDAAPTHRNRVCQRCRHFAGTPGCRCLSATGQSRSSGLSPTAVSQARPERDDNVGKQLAVRAAFQPIRGSPLRSVGGACFVRQSASAQVLSGASQATRHLTQTDLAPDLEYSRDHWLVRVEGILSSWNVCRRSPRRCWLHRFVRSASQPMVSTRSRSSFYVAGRADQFGFSSISVSFVEGRPIPWDVPVTRNEDSRVRNRRDDKRLEAAVHVAADRIVTGDSDMLEIGSTVRPRRSVSLAAFVADLD